jgi:hypothetical protein
MHKGVIMAMHFRQLLHGGHDSIVTLLLEKGADVNAQGGYYGNALQAASCLRSCLCCDTIVREGG